MAVAALDPFSMFMLLNGPAFLKGEDKIINAVVRNSYLLPRFMEGKDMSILLQGGTKIKDIAYLAEDSDADFYSSTNQDFDYRNQQVGTEMEVNWRLLKNSTMWTDHETEMSGGDGEVSFGPNAIGKFHRFKRMGKMRYMNLWTTQIHKMEDSTIATPNKDSMEDGSTAKPIPNSIGVYITSSSSAGNTGLPNTGLSSAAWTTLQGVGTPHVGNLTGKWRNQNAFYATPNSTLQAENFWTGMRELHSKCRFERLPRFGAYSEPTRSPTFYAVSLWGLIAAEFSLRSPQDAYLAGRQDASFPSPMFHGVPFVYIAGLGAATILNDNSNLTVLTNESGTVTVGGAIGSSFRAGPTVWAIQGATTDMVMHRNRVMYRVPPFHPDRQPFTTVMVTDTWYNFFQQNRRECGVLRPAPSTAITTPVNPGAGV